MESLEIITWIDYCINVGLNNIQNKELRLQFLSLYVFCIEVNSRDSILTIKNFIIVKCIANLKVSFLRLNFGSKMKVV